MKPGLEHRLRGLPWFLLSLFAMNVLLAMGGPRARDGFHLNAFARLPVLSGGRVKPIDTVARTSLLMMRGKQSVRFEGRSIPASAWMLDMLFRPSVANQYPVLGIDDPDVLGMMGIQQTRQRYFTFDDLKPHLQAIETQAAQADALKPDQRDRFQNALLNLHSKLILYQKLLNTVQFAGSENVLSEYRHFVEVLSPALVQHMGGRKPSKAVLDALSGQTQRYAFIDEAAEFYVLPGDRGMKKDDWVSVGRGLLDTVTTVSVHPGVLAYAEMGDAWRAQNPGKFNLAVTNFRTWLGEQSASHAARASAEKVFNDTEPFYQSMMMYVTAFLLVFLSWLYWPGTLRKSAFALIVLAFAVHTGGLLARMILQGRPPVTNLYSSAIFVGWAAVFLGIILERLYRNGMGSLVSSMIGFLTLIIAHHLTSQGDTMEMMRAVLDSNFWLATHVVTITIGYSSTFLSGFLAIVYLVRRIWDRSWNEEAASSLERMVYGIVCFSLFFSFVGTILGGIWADQSWGRFWGWDPKENGALMIVLWNAFILHARIGNLATPRVFIILTVFGNVITACSWFGVNMLGIGLHSYGFMDKAFVWLVLFTISQVAIMALGFFPTRQKSS